MLAPNDTAAVVGSLRRFYANTLAADKLSNVGQSMQIYSVSHEAQWIASLRPRLSLLARSCTHWQICKAGILSQILSPFLDYNNLFTSVSAFLQTAETGEMAAALLGRLVEQLDSNVKSAQRARVDFDTWIDDVHLNIEPMNQSIAEGWRDLGAGEKKIIRLAEQITQTQIAISTLEGTVGIDSIASGTVSNIASVMAGTASMIYSVAIAGYAVPYLSVGVMFFTLGKMFYDIFATSGFVHQAIADLKQYSLDLTFEQSALAQTKSALMFLYDTRDLIVKQRSMLQEAETFWESEARTVRLVRNQFALDSHYTKENPEILQLEIAKSIWNSVQNAAKTTQSALVRPIDSRTQIHMNV